MEWKHQREHREEQPITVLWATHISLWFAVKNVWHTALHNVFTMWFHLSQSHFASSWFSHLSGVSKPLPLNLKNSYSWIFVPFLWKIQSWKWGRHLAMFLKKSSFWEGLCCWMHNFLFQTELATNPFHLQVLRYRAFSSSGNRDSFAHSALKAKTSASVSTEEK